MSLERAAEQALIGALLLQPWRLADLRPWLQVNDFYGTAPHQAFAAILAVDDRADPVSPESVDAEIRESVPRGTQLADAPWLVTAMQATPEPGRALVYGRMVLELSIRRHIGLDAVRLRQEGEQARTANELNMVFAAVDTMRHELVSLHRRESAALDLHSVAPPHAGALPGLVRFPRYEHLQAERELVLGAVDRPASLDVIARWLRTADFSDDECGLLYGELTALHDAHNPIDRITLAWRAAKVGIKGPTSDLLLAPQSATAAAVPQDAVLVARRVLEQSVQAAVLATADELERISSDAGQNATGVAHARLGALWPQQRRLVKANVSSLPSAQQQAP